MTGLQALALAKHATEGLGKMKIGIIYVQNDFGQPGAVAAEKIVKAAGADVVGMEAYAFTDNDMSAQLQKLKNAGADCLICISYGKDGALVLKLMKEMGIDLPVVISSGVMVPAARNLIAPDELAHVNGVMDAYLAPERGPDVAAYIKTFKERFKVDPDPFGSCYYDGAWIMKQVMDKVGTDRTKIRDELRLVKDYKGVTNSFTTDECGQHGPFAGGVLDQARHARSGVHPHDYGVISRGMPHTSQVPLRRAAGERVGPIAKQWEGEVVLLTDQVFRWQTPRPTSPSPRYARVPSLSPRDDAGGEGPGAASRT